MTALQGEVAVAAGLRRVGLQSQAEAERQETSSSGIWRRRLLKNETWLRPHVP